ncbi:Oligopeptide transport system permease protein OppC [Paenibacillus pasadenensis]|uniref:Oligopeptide transport system permease protein OppC n=1 Tax=Paenibacillus pasadenensis TaxID=217090 RepID=A0A2N5NB13_9BACL|nr:ABC transporter permease [Paenibacillus pasadenensis]PLT47536.1 Oligopeptide transport system permease protein OppC [Paenibacillus pasadenensis]
MSVPDSLFVPMNRDAVDAEAIVRPRLSFAQEAWRRLKQNRLAFAGALLIVLLALLATVGPYLPVQSYDKQVLTDINLAPSAQHWFGTDELGRDVFARIVYGARISLFIGLAATLIDVVIGIVYGGIAGYVGGRADNVMMRFVDMLYGVPYLLIVILLMVVMGPGLATIIVALSATGWIGMARVVRGQVLSLKSSEYVLAARSMGSSGWRIIRKHLVPNAMGVILVQISFSVPSAIFAEAFLSFLGLGIQPPLASWGVMASDGLSVILSGQWWRLFFPALFISVTMLAFNLLGDGLQDIFNPRQRRS